MSVSVEAILAAVDLLVPSFQASDLEELEVQHGELLVRLARPRLLPGPPAPVVPGVLVAGGSAVVPAGAAAAPAAPVSPFGQPAAGHRFISAPLTGVWYAAPSPGARSYITVGDEVGAGTVIGLIEAMKLFNEIKSDVGGKVTRILVESGTLVKRQQPLVEVDPA
jgi:acetyl-CoA carboxylase biotin carboxyl carrier protein